MLVLNFVSDLLGHFVNNTGHTMPWVGVFMGLLTLATFLGMLAVLAICFFASIQRYYKLLGEQGYLMLALPVHAWQHLAAKLICGVLWTLFGFFYFGICGTLTDVYKRQALYLPANIMPRILSMLLSSLYRFAFLIVTPYFQTIFSHFSSFSKTFY